MPHKLSGDLSIGKALISPRKDKRGAEIYRNMVAVKKGDLVLHLVDNSSIVGISKVESEWDKNPDFKHSRKLNHGGGAGQDPRYKITLKGYIAFAVPINKSDIFKEFKNTLLSIARAKYFVISINQNKLYI